MARTQMLYVGPKGRVNYEGAGNAEIGPGAKGTLSLWFHPSIGLQRGAIVQIYIDDDNYLLLRRDQEPWVLETYGAGHREQLITQSTNVAWRHVVATWDFSAGTENGVLRLYLDGVEVTESPASSAWAPLGAPEQLRIGPGPEAGNAFGSVMDGMAIWDDAATAGEVSELYGEGRLHVPDDADCSGSLLFCATWDGSFDAHVAEGSPTATFDGDADQWCRLDVGSRAKGKRVSYSLGMPAHDDSETDRVPAGAVLRDNGWGTVTVTNGDEWTELELDASSQTHPVGMSLQPWLPELSAPMTLRINLHVPSVPERVPVAVGVHSYYAPIERRFECDSGCTKTTLVASNLAQADDYWADAELSMLSGVAANERLPVASSSSADRSITVAGELSAAPEADNVGYVAFPGRIEPWRSGGQLHRLECDLGQGADRFAMIEMAQGEGTGGYTCINLGRMQRFPDDVDKAEVFFGKRDSEPVSDWTATVRIDRIEVDGPGTYSETSETDDAFMVVDPESGESPKIWRLGGLTREMRQPEQYPTPQDIQEAIVEPGTWRETIEAWPSWMAYDAEEDCIRALLLGTDSSGVQRAGYVLGTWDDGTGTVMWADDPDPRNPMFTVDELETALGEAGGRWYAQFNMLNGVFAVDEDDWALVFTAGGGMDHITSCVLTGAPDRYSFDPAKHFDPSINPLTPPKEGLDKVVPEGGGTGLFGNWDCEAKFVENPWARDRGQRFWGYARAKTLMNLGTRVNYQIARPLACVVTGDFRGVAHKPWRNQIIVPAWGWYHWPHPGWFGPSTVGLIVDNGGVTQSDVTLQVSEDGVHLQNPLDDALIPRNSAPFNDGYLQPQTNPVRLGTRRLYWYRRTKVGTDVNMASIRLNGETLYRLEDGETEGWLETSVLRREDETWDELRLNVDPQGGLVEVAVIDAETEEVLAGYDYADCDELEDGVETRVRWQETGLPEVTAERIRLRIKLTRTSAGDPSPELYSWMIAASLHEDRPRVTQVKVEDRINPAKVSNPWPELSWEYEDDNGREQTAYHVLVASEEQTLDANEGDLWDSGVVVSDERTAKYEGEELSSEWTYFWKVRVRNGEGVWSEEW